MLSPLLQKLMFVSQFGINEGKVEILGNRYILLDASQFLVLQGIDKTKAYNLMKDISGKQIKNLVEHAQVYKGVKDQAIKNIIEIGKKVGKTDEGMIKTLQEIFDIYGFGKMEIIELDNKKANAIVRITDSTMAREYLKTKAKSKTPVCTITSGVLAGMFEYILGKDVDCIEEKCVAKGDDFCEFELD